MLDGLRPGKFARLDRLFQNDLHGLSELAIPGIELALVIIEFHADLKMSRARPSCRARNLRRYRLRSSAPESPQVPPWHARTLRERSQWTGVGAVQLSRGQDDRKVGPPVYCHGLGYIDATTGSIPAQRNGF